MLNVELANENDSNNNDLADTLTLQDETKSIILKEQKTHRAEECRVRMIVQVSQFLA